MGPELDRLIEQFNEKTGLTDGVLSKLKDNKYERSGLYQYPDKIKVGIFANLDFDLGLVFLKD